MDKSRAETLHRSSKTFSFLCSFALPLSPDQISSVRIHCLYPSFKGGHVDLRRERLNSILCLYIQPAILKICPQSRIRELSGATLATPRRSSGRLWTVVPDLGLVVTRSLYGIIGDRKLFPTSNEPSAKSKLTLTSNRDATPCSSSLWEGSR